jgi:hypothetical protein
MLQISATYAKEHGHDGSVLEGASQLHSLCHSQPMSSMETCPIEDQLHLIFQINFLQGRISPSSHGVQTFGNATTGLLVSKAYLSYCICVRSPVLAFIYNVLFQRD